MIQINYLPEGFLVLLMKFLYDVNTIQFFFSDKKNYYDKKDMANEAIVLFETLVQTIQQKVGIPPTSLLTNASNHLMQLGRGFL